MAKIKIKHLDFNDDNSISCSILEFRGGFYVSIDLYDEHSDSTYTIDLDKSTAIRFAKTLRTEINKIE